MQTMFETPNNTVPQLEPKPLTNSMDENVEGINFPIMSYVVTDLPAEAPVVSQNSRAFAKRVALLLEILRESDFFLVSLPDVVGW